MRSSRVFLGTAVVGSMVGGACVVGEDPASGGSGGAGGFGEASAAITQCVTFRRGSNGTVADAPIWQAYPTYNEGSGSNLWTGKTGTRARSLLRFDLSSIPSGAAITSASVSLYTSNSHLTTVNVHRATASWNESTVTWSSFGTSYDSTIASTFTTGGWGTRTFNAAGLVQQWVSGAAPNDGFLLEEDASGYATGYESSESGSAADRPTLTVCYDTGGSTSTAASTASSSSVASSSSSTSASSSSASSSSASSSSSSSASSSSSSSSGAGGGGGGGATFRFAVIGDYGAEGGGLPDVAAMVHGWNPDAIVTVGDNVYSTETEPYDPLVGRYYQDFIYPYSGAYGAGSPSARNRFWPILGNHDYDILPKYLAFFTLPNNEHYYDVELDPGTAVHLFALVGDDREPDGNTADSIQGHWLQNKLAGNHSCFKIVTEHEPPYCSTIGQSEGPDIPVQWPYHDWGADLVMSGSRHGYERLDVNGHPYTVNGAGGGYLWGDWNIISPYSVYRFPTTPQRYGAQLVTVTVQNGLGTLTASFYGVGDTAAEDTLTITKTCN